MPSVPRVEHEFSPRVEKELLKHPGGWVAISGTRVVGEGSTASEAYRAAKGKGIDDPLIYQVPEDRRTVYFY